MLTWDDYNNDEALNATPPAPVVDKAVETLAEPAPAPTPQEAVSATNREGVAADAEAAAAMANVDQRKSCTRRARCSARPRRTGNGCRSGQRR